MNAGDLIANRYRLESKLGEGGLGVVWTAWQIGLERRVAIKFLKPDTDTRDRFRREARTLGQLSHPNCVAVFDTDTTADGEPYIVMEHLEGVDLGELVGAVDWRRASALVGQVANALVYAHDQGVIHRDLKPDNVFVCNDGGAEVVKVLDFGIAKLVGRKLPDITKTNEVIGTPAYMSPEQLRGARDVGPASDIYSLGVMFYTLLSGRLPFEGAPMAVALKHLSEDPPPLANVPPQTHDLVMAMLAKEPAQRPHARTVTARLSAPASTVAPTTEPAAPRHTGTTQLKYVLAALLAAVFVLCIVVVVMLQHDEEADVVQPDSDPTRAAGLIAAADEHAAPLDTGEPAAETVDAGAMRCEPSPIRNAGSVTITTPDHRAIDVNLVLPGRYDRRKVYPLVVLLHERGQTGANILEDTGLVDVAQRRDFIIAAPNRPLGAAWKTAEDFEDVRAATAQIRDQFCVDATRIFAVGQAVSGRMLDQFACLAPEFRAIATHGQRANPGQQWCPRPIPNLYLAGLADGYNPVEGGTSCSGTTQKLSLDDHEKGWRDQNVCRGERGPWFEHRGSTCWTWDCSASFVSCHLKDGGHNWPHVGQRLVADIEKMFNKSKEKCEGKPADFPYAETVWRFFEEVSAGGGALDR